MHNLAVSVDTLVIQFGYLDSKKRPRNTQFKTKEISLLGF